MLLQRSPRTTIMRTRNWIMSLRRRPPPRNMLSLRGTADGLGGVYFAGYCRACRRFLRAQFEFTIHCYPSNTDDAFIPTSSVPSPTRVSVIIGVNKSSHLCCLGLKILEMFEIPSRRCQWSFSEHPSKPPRAPWPATEHAPLLFQATIQSFQNHATGRVEPLCWSPVPRPREREGR